MLCDYFIYLDISEKEYVHLKKTKECVKHSCKWCVAPFDGGADLGWGGAGVHGASNGEDPLKPICNICKETKDHSGGATTNLIRYLE